MKRAINCRCLGAGPGFLLPRRSGSIIHYQQRCTGTALQQAWAVRSPPLKDKCLLLERAQHGFHLTWRHCMCKLGRREHRQSLTQLLLYPTILRLVLHEHFGSQYGAGKKNLVKFASKLQKECALWPNRATTWGPWCNCWRDLVEEIRNKKENRAGNCRVRWQEWPLEGCLSPTPYTQVVKKRNKLHQKFTNRIDPKVWLAHPM